MVVIGESSTGQQTLASLRAQQPDVVLMDVAMPDMNGLEAAALVTKKFPGVRVIILSMHANEEYVMKAFRAAPWGTCTRTRCRGNWSWQSAR
jgi:DNA-binding NarL/FixJ family response regulator